MIYVALYTYTFYPQIRDILFIPRCISYFPHFAGIILGQFREAGQPAMRSHTFA